MGGKRPSQTCGVASTRSTVLVESPRCGIRNPTRSYRSSAPLRVVAAVSDWTRLTPEDRQSWRERLGTLRQGEILG